MGYTIQIRINKTNKPSPDNETRTHAFSVPEFTTGLIPRTQRMNAAPNMIVRTLIDTKRSGPTTGVPLDVTVQFIKTICKPAVDIGGTNAAAIAAPAKADERWLRVLA